MAPSPTTKTGNTPTAALAHDCRSPWTQQLPTSRLLDSAHDFTCRHSSMMRLADCSSDQGRQRTRLPRKLAKRSG